MASHHCSPHLRQAGYGSDIGLAETDPNPNPELLLDRLLLDVLLTGRAGVQGVSTPTTPETPPPPLPPSNLALIFSSQVELSNTTSCVRNSLLCMDLGLQIGGHSVWRLLPWITASLRFAIDLEHPHRSPSPPPGSQTSSRPDLHCTERLRTNQTAGIFRSQKHIHKMQMKRPTSCGLSIQSRAFIYVHLRSITHLLHSFQISMPQNQWPYQKWLGGYLEDGIPISIPPQHQLKLNLLKI